MQSIILSVFAIGTVLGSGAAVVQHAYQDNATGSAALHPASQSLVPESEVSAACQPVRFRIYFPGDSNEIDAAGRALISKALNNVNACEDLNILIGAPDPHQDSHVQRVEASERSAALLAELEASGLNGNVYVAREDGVLNGPGAYIDPPNAAVPDYLVVSIEPSDAQPMAANEALGLKT
jgi:hypothetical protein